MGATVSPGVASAARGALGLQLHCAGGGGGGGYLGAAESRRFACSDFCQEASDRREGNLLLPYCS